MADSACPELWPLKATPAQERHGEQDSQWRLTVLHPLSVLPRRAGEAPLKGLRAGAAGRPLAAWGAVRPGTPCLTTFLLVKLCPRLD